MNILIVSQYFWPENFIINDLVEELISRGHNITIITGKPNYPSGSLNKDYSLNPDLFSSYSGAEIIRVSIVLRGKTKISLFFNYISFAISASMIGAYKLRKKNFDVIFAYEPSPVTVAIPAIIFSKIKRVPLVLWVLDLWPDTLQAYGVILSKYFLKFFDKIVRFIYNNCDLILGQSKSYVNLIRERSTNVSVKYFPSWAESVFYKTQELNPYKKNNKTTFDVVFSGNTGIAQDFPSILDAMELLKDINDIKLIIIGNGSMFEWIESEISKRHLTKSVTLLGRKPLEDMPKLLAEASALLLSLRDKPIYSITIPAKLQVYLQAKKPILAMINGEAADIVNESNSGITCKSGDAQCLANAIKAIYSMSDHERIAMGNNAYKFSETWFDRKTLIDQLEDWMRVLVDRKKLTR